MAQYGPMPNAETQCIAFDGQAVILAGRLADVARAVKAALDRSPDAAILIFDDVSSQVIDLDLRGTLEEILARLARAEPTTPLAASAAVETPPKRGPGRPKLGVVAREVTLLPRHWEWLAEQPGSASVTLRQLVEQARHASSVVDRQRRAQEAAYRFMTAMAGNEPGYEDAIRALYASDEDDFTRHAASWPADVRDHASRLASRAFAAPAATCET